MPTELNRIRELAGLQQEAAAISPNQIEAFKKWYATYSKMQSKDVYNYAKGIFKAYMETGVTELDGASKQDPRGKAYDDLAKIFPGMDGDIEAIGHALQSQGVDPLDMEAQEESAVSEDISANGKSILVKAGFDPMKVEEYMAVFNDHGDTSVIDRMNKEKVALADAMSMVLASHDIENESAVQPTPVLNAVKETPATSQVDEAIKKATAQLKSFSNFDGLKPYKPKKK